MVLACHAAFGTGEVAYARLWLGEWLDKKPHDTRAIRLLYTTLLELGEELGLLSSLAISFSLNPLLPREELIEQLIRQQAHEEALALVESAPTLTPELALKGHEITTSTGPRRLEAPWLERAEALAPRNHKVIFTRYKIQPDQTQAVQALEKLASDEAAFSDFDTVQTALRILAEHRSLALRLGPLLLLPLEPVAQPDRCLELGLLWQAFDNQERAESNLKLWLANVPHHPLATLSLARLFLGQGRAEEAFKVLTALPREALFGS